MLFTQCGFILLKNMMHGHESNQYTDSYVKLFQYWMS